MPVYLLRHPSQHRAPAPELTPRKRYMHQHDTRTEAALYWVAVSLIVCEGLSIEKAADRLGVDADGLTEILHRRQSLRPSAFAYPTQTAQIVRFPSRSSSSF